MRTLPRTFVLSAAFLFSLVSAALCEVVSADSRISSVTAYPDSAMVYRQAQVKLGAGEHSVVFSDIIPAVDENSLRVSAKGSAEARLYGAQLKREFLKEVPVEKVKELEAAIRQLQDTVQGLQNTRTVLQEEKSFLDSIRLYSGNNLPRELVTRMPSSQDLDATYKLLDARLRENFSAVMDTELKIREANEKMDVLRRELGEVSGPAQKQRNSIVVDLEVSRGGSLELTVSYLVRGVSWQPVYDCRADFDKSEVELVSYALVRQNTGEEWNGVDLTLSTARPSVGGNLPYVAPWFLRPFTPQQVFAEKRKGLAGGGARQYEAFDAEPAVNTEALEGNAPALAPVAASVNYAASQDRGIAVVYAVNRKVTIKPDGSEQKIPVSAQTLKANFEYSSYPRAVTTAYLGSRVQNSPQLQLMAGRVSVFLDGDYISSSQLDSTAPGEEFDLYLGADENVKVKRELVEKKVDETLIANIPSPTRKTNFKYKISVENYKTKKIRVKLFETMPVPQDDRIKVKVNQVSLEPKQKDWKDRKGVWLWEFDLEPKAKQEIFYSFTLEHPREMTVEGL